MNMQPSHLIFLGGTVVYVAIRAIFKRKTVGAAKPISRSSTQDRLLIILVSGSQVVLPFMLVFTPWLDWANYKLPKETVCLGVASMLGALWLFWRSHADLGHSWSVTLELGQDHRLVTEGVYRIVRHPMYASFFVLGLSQAFLLSNWCAGWSALAAVLLMYVIRVPREERMMLESFGDEYRAYMKRTGGVFPRMSGETDA